MKKPKKQYYCVVRLQTGESLRMPFDEPASPNLSVIQRLELINHWNRLGGILDKVNYHYWIEPIDLV